MQLNRAPVKFAREEANTVPAVAGRTAAVIILAGCTLTILATFLPWMEKAVLGVSLTATGFQIAGILLVVMSVISAGIAGSMPLRRPTTARVAVVLLVLAVMQLSLAIWVGVRMVYAIDQVSSHQVLINAIGTGAYGTVLGSVVTMAGAILAWTKRWRA